MKKVIFYILGSAFFFSTMEVTLKIAAADMDALQLTFIRFMAGGLFLLPFALREMKKNKVSLNVKDYLYMFMLGIICIPVSMVFFQLGVMYSNASLRSWASLQEASFPTDGFNGISAVVFISMR